MRGRKHWQQVYQTKAPEAVSWYQPRAERSLAMIEGSGLPRSAPIIDVGGGASTLVDDLLARGYENLTILDISAAALRHSQARLGGQAATVSWLEADVTKVELPRDAFALWHDRAAFHFLTEPEQRLAYRKAVLHALKPGGHIVIASFALDGPEKCSGLPVRRYDAAGLQAELGEAFTLVSAEREAHATPFGTTQQFTYCHLQRAA